MSQLTENCPKCGWSHRWAFQYHGELPVEHPICPTCGEDLDRQYAFEPRELSISPEEMQALIQTDEAGFPVDQSPQVLELGRLLDERLEEAGVSPLRVYNVDGVVDLELRPYVHHREGVEGVKLTANVGRSVYSMALLELLARLNHQLPGGAVVPHTSAYGLPCGAVELFPFGTEVNLYYQRVITREEMGDERWFDILKECQHVASALARQMRRVMHMMSAAELVISPEREPFDDGAGDVEDEFGASAYGSMRLEDVQETFLDELLRPEPDAEELVERIRSFLQALSLDTLTGAPGVFLFKLDSARVRVSVVERGGRQLIRYHAVLLANIDPLRFEDSDPELPARALATLNDQILAGRCLIEPEDPRRDEGPSQIVFEKTLLGADLDLSEFALTLAMVAEEADRMDNLLQATFGGLRADQLEQPPETPPVDLQPLLQRLSTHGFDEVERQGVVKVRAQVRVMLEELRLPARQDDQDDFWFTHGSARFSVRVWQDVRATYITLRARVLREVTRPSGLSEALNAINRQVRLGAFVLKDERHVDLVETILADDLSIEEFAYALVSIGQLADLQDNLLRDAFGGELAIELPEP